MDIGIVGAGIVGLTTALETQKEFPKASVTILADKFYTDTVSSVAAGIFRPSTSFAGPTPEITQQWINDAYYYWDDIRKTANASIAGITQLSGYYFSSTNPYLVQNRFIDKLVPVYRNVTNDELSICPGNWKYGTFFTTLLIECDRFLPWATQKYRLAGGKIVTKSIKTFNELNGQFDVIINCAGLEAKYLCNDPKLVPIRGQLLKVKAPWIKTAFYFDSDTYIVPGFNGIVSLGGTRQYDSYNLSIDKYDTAAIRERCEQYLPSLIGSEIVRERVGLRPHRDPVRVEPELLEYSNLKIIHNYGHGGYGVTTSPGTAKYAIKHVRDILSMSGSKL